jgi:cytochrome c551/c552
MTPPIDASTTIVEGLLVYKKYGCGSCHTLHSANAGSAIAPPSDGIGVRAAERIANPGYTGHATSAAAYIRESITNPDMYYVTGFKIGQIRMPRYATMTKTELEALVQMLLRQ